MIAAKMAIAISAMIDKMDLDLTAIEGKDQAEVGQILISTLVRRLYRAEDEFYRLLSLYYSCTPAEAADKDIIQAIRDILKDAGVSELFT